MLLDLILLLFLGIDFHRLLVEYNARPPGMPTYICKSQRLPLLLFPHERYHAQNMPNISVQEFKMGISLNEFFDGIFVLYGPFKYASL